MHFITLWREEKEDHNSAVCYYYFYCQYFPVFSLDKNKAYQRVFHSQLWSDGDHRYNTTDYLHSPQLRENRRYRVWLHLQNYPMWEIERKLIAISRKSLIWLVKFAIDTQTILKELSFDTIQKIVLQEGISSKYLL